MKSLFVSFFANMEELTPEETSVHGQFGNTILILDDRYEDPEIVDLEDVIAIQKKIKEEYNKHAAKGATHERMKDVTLLNFKWLKEADL